jgi:heptaprenyl diphosphate synthase
MKRWTRSATETARRELLTAFLGAFCFFLSAVEYMIPKPLPFMRLGIANLPILLAVDILPLPWFLLLALVKVVGMSLVSGSLFSYVALFSLAGTMSAALVMWASRKAGGRLLSMVGVSILGAVASNAVQIFLAMAFVFGRAARLIAPPFLGMGLVTGALLGMLVERFMLASSWYARVTGSAVPREKPFVRRAARAKSGRALQREERRKARRERYEGLFDPRILALAGLAVAIAYLFQRSLPVKAGMFAVFLAAAVLSGKRVSALSTILVSACIVAANLLVPIGRVIARVGPLVVTQTALAEGLDRALVFEGLLCLSKASILPSLRMPGRFGKIVATAFVYYDRIVEYRGSFRPATLIRDTDTLMLRVWEQPPEEAVPAAPRPFGAAGAVILAAAVLTAVGLLVVR